MVSWSGCREDTVRRPFFADWCKSIRRRIWTLIDFIMILCGSFTDQNGNVITELGLSIWRFGRDVEVFSEKSL
jgi:hypothetical protein